MSGAQRQLTLTVGGQSYAIDGSMVREVVRRPRLTRVPLGPSALLGVSNLRGTVLPVVSLARLMALEPGPEQRIVVIELGGILGLLVDAVVSLGDVIAGADIRPLDVAALLAEGFPRPVTSHASRHVIGPASQAPVAPLQQRQLVTFLVNQQTFALPLQALLEVQRLPDEIAVASRGDQIVLGAANLREQSIPIISIAGLLGLSGSPADSNHRMLIVEHEGQQVGLVADEVQSILRLDEMAIDPVPMILRNSSAGAELDAIGRPGPGLPLVSILSVAKLFATVPVGEAENHSRPDENRVATVAGTTREQFVIFALGTEQYGVPIAAVAEVIRLPDQVTRLPNGPRFVVGLINLRGRPVPLIDQRLRFDAPPGNAAVQPRVLILHVGGLEAGFLVDVVSEIVSVDQMETGETPPLSSESTAMFKRVIERDGGLILLVDPEELLSQAEREVVADIAARQNTAGPA